MNKYFYPIFKLPTFYERDYVKEELPLWVKWWLLGKAGRELSEILTGSEFTLLHTLNKKFKLLQIKGNTEQEQLTGKNLFDKDNANVLNNIFISGDSVLKSGNNNITIYIPCKGNTTYTIQKIADNVFRAGTTQTIPSKNIIVDDYNNNPTGTNITLTTSANAKYIVVFIKNAESKKSLTELYNTLQIEEGSTATSYEPYCGGIPSPNPQFPQQIKNVTGNVNVKIQNKNLFTGDYSQFNSTGGEGTLYDYFKLPENDKVYTISVIAKNDFTPTRTTYLGFSGNGGDANLGTRWVIAGTSTSTITKGTKISINNLDNEKNLRYVSMYTKGATNLKNFTDNFEIQIEQGSTATSYVEHEEQNYTFSLKSKNLLDISTLEKGYVSVTGIISVYDTMEERYSKFIKVKPDTNYIFSIIETSSTYDNWFGVGEYSSNNYSSFIRRDTMTTASQSYIQFTTSNTTEYIVVSARNLKDATKIQLEEGTTATDYEPYYDIKAMQGTTLEDDGIHNNRNRVNLWEQTTYIGRPFGNYYRYQIDISDAKTYSTNDGSTALCNCFYRDIDALTSENAKVGMFAQYRNTRGFYFISDKSTTTEFIAELTENNAVLEYELAEEEIIPYNETQATQYNAIKEAHTYKDETYISGESDELPPLLDIQYWEERGT